MLQQQVRSPEYLFFEADKKKHFLSGSEAVREAIRKANVDVAISYPITPQSESMHLVGELFAEGYVKEYFRGENEFAVMSSVAGAAMAMSSILVLSNALLLKRWQPETVIARSNSGE